MTQERGAGRPWDRHQWEGDQGRPGQPEEELVEADAGGAATSAEAWNEAEWVGDQGKGFDQRPVVPTGGSGGRIPGEDSGPTGSGAPPGIQDWAGRGTLADVMEGDDAPLVDDLGNERVYDRRPGADEDTTVDADVDRAALDLERDPGGG